MPTVDYRGLLATRDIKTDEIVLSIPANLIITLETAKKSFIAKEPLNQYILQKLHSIGSFVDNTFMASYVLEEKEKPNC